jgi:hypothetical protein
MKPWFVVKRYGYGLAPSGWGWLLTFAYVALLGLAAIFAGQLGPAATAMALAALTVGFFVVMALTSDRKPWRWRWGGDDET